MSACGECTSDATPPPPLNALFPNGMETTRTPIKPKRGVQRFNSRRKDSDSNATVSQLVASKLRMVQGKSSDGPDVHGILQRLKEMVAEAKRNNPNNWNEMPPIRSIRFHAGAGGHVATIEHDAGVWTVHELARQLNAVEVVSSRPVSVSGRVRVTLVAEGASYVVACGAFWILSVVCQHWSFRHRPTLRGWCGLLSVAFGVANRKVGPLRLLVTAGIVAYTRDETFAASVAFLFSLSEWLYRCTQ